MSHSFIQVLPYLILRLFNHHAVSLKCFRLVDNLPLVTRIVTHEAGANHVQYEHGYRLGFLHNKNVAVNNHLKIILHYHTEDK